MLTVITSREVNDVFARLWKASAPLTATGVLMLFVLVAAMVGLVVDPRMIGGAPAWLKPAKFAASIAVYTVTLAWIYTLAPGLGKTGRIVGRTTAVAMALEMAIIVTQAWRGTTSHFNVGTTFDAVLFAAMGITIVGQTVASGAVAAALWRTRFADRALGIAVRVGMTITILGAASGGLMTAPTAGQLAEARGGAPLTVVGAHTVGAADGGAGLPVTGWSTEHGDLRVPHFVGLHAVQVLPLLALWLRRRRLVLTASASYFALFILLLVQAYRGESLTAPGPGVLAMFGIWGLVTAGGIWMAATGDRQLTASATTGGV
jgi:hypothetical protein